MKSKPKQTHSVSGNVSDLVLVKTASKIKIK